MSQICPVQASLPTSWKSILILSSHLRLDLPSGLFPSGFSTKTLYAPLLSPIRATCPAHSSAYTWENKQVFKCCFSFLFSSSCHFLLSTILNHFLSLFCLQCGSRNLIFYVLIIGERKSFRTISELLQRPLSYLISDSRKISLLVQFYRDLHKSKTVHAMQQRTYKWKSCCTEIEKTHPVKARVSLPSFKGQVMKTNKGVGVNNLPFNSRWIWVINFTPQPL